MYVRQLSQDFNAAHNALELLLLQAPDDRPDLVRELSHQRLLFYRGLIGINVTLALHVLGFDAVPSLQLLAPLERLHLEFCRLVPVPTA